MNGIAEKKHDTRATHWPSGAVTIEHLPDCWCKSYIEDHLQSERELAEPLPIVIGRLGEIYNAVNDATDND